MQITMLQGKIHRATVTQAELDYVGSITVDEDLLDAAGIREYQMVQIVDVNNGNRFETYTIAGERGSGVMCLNGAAARCASVNDKIILMAYAQMTPEEAKENKPNVVFVNDEKVNTTFSNSGCLIIPKDSVKDGDTIKVCQMGSNSTIFRESNTYTYKDPAVEETDA